MKRNPLKKFIPFRLAMIIAPLLAAWPRMSPAATIYWDNSGGTANDWASVANWSTVAGGGTNPAAIPGTADIAQFSATSVTAAQTANLNADRSIQGAIFSTTLGHTLAGGGTNRTLTLGSSGLLKSGTGAATIGSTTGGQQVAVALGADQSWDNNNNTGAISVLNGVSSNAAGPRILSLGGSSTAANTVSGVIGNGSGQVSVNKTGAGTWVLSGANTFTGGTTLTGGILQLNNGTGAGPAGSTITYPAAGTGRLFLNGGVTASYNLDITAGTTGAVGQGLVQQTGTGQATINGTINLGGQPANGGVFVGGAAAGNELVVGAPINGGAVGMSQRDGRVIYRGGGTLSGTFTATGTALIGANNGLPSNLGVFLGGSASATLDLNGFDQSLTGISLGNAGAANAFIGNINIGAKTLTLNGNISTISAATVTTTHNITSTTGALDVGATGSTVTVSDSLAVDDLVISGNVTGAGGLTKTGAGSLALNGSNVFGPVNVNGGTLSAGRAPAFGAFSSLALNFGAGTTLFTKIGSTQSDIMTTGTLTAAGVNVLPFQADGALSNGTYPLISYTGASPGTAGFNLIPTGHMTASLIDTGSAISLQVTGNDRVLWDGTNGSAWATGATGNWKLQSNATAADFVTGDDVIFADNPTSGNVDVALAVLPGRVSFTNTAATTYTVTGTAGIYGPSSLNKTGDGRTILRNLNGYIGATNVSAGTLELDHDATGNLVLTGTSGVNIAAAATVDLTRDDGGFTFSRNLSGPGTVQINAHSVAGSTTPHTVALTGANNGFSGTLRLLSPASGTYRVSQPPPANLGGGTIEVQNGAQIYTAASQTYTNAISISGAGFVDTNGMIGALRLENGANWAGPVTVNSPARIGCHNGSATVSGAISGGDLEVNVTNYNNNYTLIFTGANSYGSTIIGGGNTQTAGPPSMRLNIGANGTTGTLGTGNVTINGDGANGVLGFDRSNGYTLLPGQTITAGGTNLLRTFVDLDCQGAGFNDNGSTIDMGGSSFVTGGQVRAGQSRANTVSTFSGNLTAGRLGNAVVNNSTININNGASINVGYFTTGEAANNGGTVNQATGSTVNVTEQLRVGHFGTETSVYNMNGGSLTLTGASPSLTPSTAGAGAAGSTGDNNVNATNPATIVGGGIYLGIDGTGIFNHNNGTVTTNWIVLDNRGDTAAGANMPDGIDRYNLNNGTLNIRSNYGLIARNASTAVSFAGGTVRVDNTGTGTGTGANITVPLDAVITTSGAGTILDTNGTGNGFTLTKNILGAAPLNLTGGGSVNLNPAANQLVQAPLITSGSGAMLTKQGLNTTTLTGSGAGFTGGITVSGGRLDVPSDSTPVSLSLAGGTTMSGEPVVSGTTSMDSATLLFDPNTPGALTTGVLNVTGTNLLDLTSIPAGAGPWTAINYTTRTGAGTFDVANAASYRVAPAIADTGSAITLNVLQGKTLAWTGATSAVWDINSSSNWLDSAPPNGAEKFFNADIVAFQDGALNPAVTISGSVIPLAVIVNNSATAYSFTSTAGNQLSGPGGITKSGTGALTLTGPNIHAGSTDITGGTVNIAAGTSLGNGSITNKVNLSGGGRLNVTAATDLGSTRAITSGTGGGALTVSNAAATTVTIPGNISGSGLLTIGSGAAGASTVVLSGNNSGSSGGITVHSDGGGATTLRLASTSAAPAGGTLTLANPTTGASGAATTLDLAGNSVPATVLVSTNSLLSGANSYRTQVLSGVSGGAIHGPLEVNGTSIVQFSANNTNALTLNGAITAGPGGFNGASSTFFIRGTGSGTINGTINLPGAIVAKTDAATWTINSSTGNNWLLTSVLSTGSLKIGANNALPIGSNLNIGQGSDAAASLFDLNGFNQEVATIIYTPGNGNSTRGITNTSLTPSTLTVNNATDISYGASTGVTGGTLQGNLSLVKAGAGNLTLAGAGNFTGSVLVSSGILTAGGTQATTALGSPTTAGRTITVSSGAELRMSTNNVFGNGVGNANLPALSVSGTVSSTRYNTVGPVTLNGGTLTQSATDSGGYEGYQFKGAISAVGTAPSLISTGNGKANHLDANTVFNVADVTGNSSPDLVVSTVLRDQSNDFGAGQGGLTKAGAGTLQLAATVAHTYTGPTSVAAGTLQVDGTLGASLVSVGSGGTLGGNGTVTAAATVASGGTVAPGASVGTLTFGSTLALASGSTFAVEITGAASADKVVAAGDITANGTVKVTLSGYTPVANDTFDVADAASITGTPTFDFADAVLTAGLTWDTSQFLSAGILKVVSGAADPFDAWASALGVTGGKGGDDDGDGANNLLEFATNSDPKTNGSGARAYGKLHSIAGDNVLTLTIAVRKSALFAAQGSKQSATKDQVVYTVEASDDLLTWNTVVVTELDSVNSAAVQAGLGLPALEADWEWHTFRTDDGTTLDPRDMIRLSVAAQP